jgi:hypothetical protein
LSGDRDECEKFKKTGGVSELVGIVIFPITYMDFVSTIEVKLQGPKTNRQQSIMGQRVFQLPSQIGIQTLSCSLDGFSSQMEELSHQSDSEENVPNMSLVSEEREIERSPRGRTFEKCLSTGNLEDRKKENVELSDEKEEEFEIIEERFSFGEDIEFKVKSSGNEVLIIEDNESQSNVIKSFLNSNKISTHQAFTLESVSPYSINLLFLGFANIQSAL